MAYLDDLNLLNYQADVSTFKIEKSPYIIANLFALKTFFKLEFSEFGYSL